MSALHQRCCTVFRNRNLLFIFDCRSYFLTHKNFFFRNSQRKILKIIVICEFLFFFHRATIHKQTNWWNWPFQICECWNKLTIGQNYCNYSHRTKIILLIFKLIIINNFYKQILTYVYFSSEKFFVDSNC